MPEPTKVNDLSVADLRALLRKKEGRPHCWNCGEHLAVDAHHLDGHHGNNSPENLAPWCKRCHNEVHDISDNLTDLGLVARQLYSIQDQRIGMNNRLFAYGNLGYTAPYAHEIYNELVELEKRAKKIVSLAVRREPVYQAYLSKIAGIGPLLAVTLISEIGDPGRFDTISALWAYAGLDVHNGKARKRTRGEMANWNARLRSTCAKKLTDQFVKLRGCFGRELYDQYKAFYTERDGNELSKGHVDNRARRKLAKVFLSCLWVAWRRMKGLPISEPYALTLPGHSHLVTPEDWAGEGWDNSWQEQLLEI